MISKLFESTTIPILEQVVAFAQARHTVLAGNLANIDTPGYTARDLPVGSFQAELRKQIEARHRPAALSPGDARYLDAAREQAPASERWADQTKTLLRHDGNNVTVEHQVSEMVKNQMQHNAALAVMNSQFRLLLTAIGEKV